MDNKELQRFKKEMQSFEELPSDRAWQRINDKMQIRDNKRSITWYRWVAVAASVIAIISTYSIYQHTYHEHKPQIFAHNPFNTDAKPVIIEDLEILDDSGIYSVENVGELNQAYIDMYGKD